MGYDVIGDIHGHAQSLRSLLERLGYTEQNGTYGHPKRQVIFLGDFIDRGPAQREVLDIVRAMIDSGQALAIMGNHEFNAIGWATPHPEHHGEFLRPHNDNNHRQHRSFLEAFEYEDSAYRDTIDWFLTLPLWLEIDDLRAVHACWNDSSQQTLAPSLNEGLRLDPVQLVHFYTKGDPLYEAAEVLLKGKEIPLPHGATFHDKDGNPRNRIRIRWWDSDARTYRDAFLGPESALTHIPDDPISGDHLLEYDSDAPPVFIGHYWLLGNPTPLAPNIACLDYSVAKPSPEAKLTAYRWDGETQLHPHKFVWIAREED